MFVVCNCFFFFQISNAVAKNIFTYGNLVDSAGLLLQVLKKPEIRYLLHFKEDASIQSEKDRKVYNAVIHNIRKYLSVVMKTKGPRKKLAEQAFRTVVAACSGPNLVKDKTVGATSSVLVIISLSSTYILLYINYTTQTFVVGCPCTCTTSWIGRQSKN